MTHKCLAKNPSSCPYHGYKNEAIERGVNCEYPPFGNEVATDYRKRIAAQGLIKATNRVWDRNGFSRRAGSVTTILRNHPASTFSQFVHNYFTYGPGTDHAFAEIERFCRLSGLTPEQAQAVWLYHVLDQTWQSNERDKLTLNLYAEYGTRTGTWEKYGRADIDLDQEFGIDYVAITDGQIIEGHQSKPPSFYLGKGFDEHKLAQVRKNIKWGKPVYYINTKDVENGVVRLYTLRDVLKDIHPKHRKEANKLLATYDHIQARRAA